VNVGICLVLGVYVKMVRYVYAHVCEKCGLTFKSNVSCIDHERVCSGKYALELRNLRLDGYKDLPSEMCDLCVNYVRFGKDGGMDGTRFCNKLNKTVNHNLPDCIAQFNDDYDY
jgi:hypothetical protein